jgi:hypothetical protein
VHMTLQVQLPCQHASALLPPVLLRQPRSCMQCCSLPGMDAPSLIAGIHHQLNLKHQLYLGLMSACRQHSAAAAWIVSKKAHVPSATLRTSNGSCFESTTTVHIADPQP